jgi:hypothetical protein
MVYERGRLVESAVTDQRVKRQPQTRASARWTVRDIQWEVALRAPVQGRCHSRIGRLRKERE